jgi:hypothetical protein
VLTFIRENGPLTKREVYIGILGRPDNCLGLMHALHELQRKGLVSYGMGKNKARGYTHKVYQVMP